MAKVPFTHLHLHTQYSLLDGAIKPNPLFERVKALGQEAIAMTDHGYLFGAVDFYLKARENGVKPILGCEAYIATGSRFDKEPPARVSGGRDAYGHQLLLAMNETGYRNLVRLITKASLEGFYYKPRIDLELLTELNEGLITTSGCLSSLVCKKLLAGERDAAWRSVEEISRVFKDRYYLELQRHGIPDQDTVNLELMKMAQELGLPLLATNDAHYLHDDDHDHHDALLCIGTAANLNDESRFRFDGRGFSVKSGEQMLEVFHDCPEAVRNSMQIAERCELEMELGVNHMPEFQVPAGSSRETVVEENAWRGLREKLGMAPDQPFENGRAQYAQRMRYELDIINNKGFAGYFLIVADFIHYAKRNAIPVGPGRGSAAGSLAAYGLGITNVDPIEHDILFERFLTPARSELPDIDVDLCKRGREQVRRYIEERYNDPSAGDEGRRVAQIITFGTLKPRAVIRDVGRVMGLPLGDVDRIAKLVPEMGKITLDAALRMSPDLRARINNDGQFKKLFETAQRLEGLVRHASTHPAGVVIGNQPLIEMVPLYREPRTDEIMTQFNMDDVGKIGLVKFDILGLSTLTIIADAERHIREQDDKNFSMEKAPLDDAETFELISRGDTEGVFQMEGSGVTDLAKQLKPQSFEELAPLIGLFRPGPIGSGMLDMYVSRKTGREPVKYLLPELEQWLKTTYGVILYQDQVLQIATGLAGYSWDLADELRYAMGKKVSAKLKEHEVRFIEGCVKNGIAKSSARTLFEQILKFGEYGFGKAHSVAYAFLVYQTAYLKAHHPRAFMAALLSNEASEQRGRLGRYIAHAREREIEVLPPDVNESGDTFTPAPNGLRFGFVGVKNLGAGAVESILETREKGGPFRSLFDFTRRVDSRRVNRRALEALVKCGAFDSLHPNRAALFEALEMAMEAGATAQRDHALGQTSLFGESAGDETADRALPDTPPWSDTERLAGEKEVLDFYVTGHPLDAHRHALLRFTNLRGGDGDARSGRKVRVGGLITKVRETRTKRGQQMAFATLEDLEGSFELVIFSRPWQQCGALLKRSRDSGTAAGADGEAPRVLPLLVSGALESTEPVKILVEDVFALEDAEERLAAELHISLTASEADRDRLLALRNLLAAHGGECAVRLHLLIPGESETLLELPNARGVEPNDALLREIDTLFGRPVAEVTL